MNPVLIGAGIGALGSAVQGKSPLTGALLGGATGGLFGGSESLLGGKIAGAFGQGAVGGTGVKLGVDAAGTAIVPSVGINTLSSQIPTTAIGANLGAIGSGALPATTATGAYAGGIPLSAGNLAGGASGLSLDAMNPTKLFNYTEPTMMDKIQGFGNDAFSFAKSNPVTTGGYALKGIEAINANPPEKVNTSAQRPVTQGQFQGYTPTASASRVAPQIVPLPINKTGMLQLDTVVAQNPELRKLYPDLFGG